MFPGGAAWFRSSYGPVVRVGRTVAAFCVVLTVSCGNDGSGGPPVEGAGAACAQVEAAMTSPEFAAAARAARAGQNSDGEAVEAAAVAGVQHREMVDALKSSKVETLVRFGEVIAGDRPVTAEEPGLAEVMTVCEERGSAIDLSPN
jgi:hypothetical protein